MDMQSDVTGRDIQAERRDDAGKFMTAQERSGNWNALPDSRPVTMMGLRSNSCRWPIGNTRDLESFRYCGAANNGGSPYCVTHMKMAFSPSRARVFVPGSSR
jgi:hypothetical protein